MPQVPTASFRLLRAPRGGFMRKAPALPPSFAGCSLASYDCRKWFYQLSPPIPRVVFSRLSCPCQTRIDTNLCLSSLEPSFLRLGASEAPSSSGRGLLRRRQGLAQRADSTSADSGLTQASARTGRDRVVCIGFLPKKRPEELAAAPTNTPTRENASVGTGRRSATYAQDVIRAVSGPRACRTSIGAGPCSPERVARSGPTRPMLAMVRDGERPVRGGF